jgi:hypothetical protein
LPAGGFVQNGTNVTINLNVAHGLVAGENILVNFLTGTPPNGQYQVATVLDPLHFTIHVPTNAPQVVVGTALVHPLAPSNLARLGNVTIGNSTCNRPCDRRPCSISSTPITGFQGCWPRLG